MMASKEGKVTLQTSSGRSRVEVLTYGATVIAWQYNSQDILFLSKKATLDGSAAIRGGIPIVFPVFGSPKDHEDHRGLEKLPKHGFARTTTWKVKESNAESAVLTLESNDHKEIQDVYQWPVHLEYHIRLSDGSLETSLKVKNLSNSSSPARFHALLHNYLAVPDVTRIGVEGLQGLNYSDKLDNKSIKSETNQRIILSGNASDRVYDGSSPDVTLHYGNDGKTLRVTRSTTFQDTVVWNPAEEGAQAIADLHPGAWKEYICLEPGSVVKPAELAAGQEWSATQTLTIA